MVVTDASVWVSAILPEDQHHAASRTWLMEYSRTGRALVAPWLLAAEITGAIARRTGEPDLALASVEWMRRTPGVELVSLDEGIGELASQLAATLSLRGADAVYVAVAQRAGTPLVTWDEEQRQRAASVVPAFTPAEL